MSHNVSLVQNKQDPLSKITLFNIPKNNNKKKVFFTKELLQSESWQRYFKQNMPNKHALMPKNLTKS